MRFNRNIYMRLYHIAFFLSNVLEKTTVFPETDNPFYDIMDISEFEKKLFKVCMKVFEKLSPLFVPFQDIFHAPPEYDPEGFYKTIPEGFFSGETIKENSYELFSSAKEACWFFCNFNHSYYLCRNSHIISTYKHRLPFLKFVQDDLYAFFSNRPKKYYYDVQNYLGCLVASINTVMSSETSKKQEQSIDYIKEIDRIVMSCLDLVFFLGNRFSFSPKITVKEKERRVAISETKKEQSSDRQNKVKEHVKNIFLKSRSEKISLRKACIDYYNSNIIELNSIKINSYRTLQNKCCKTEPNKQRSAFSNLAYIKPAYSSAFQKKITELYNDLERADRLLPKTKK